MSSLLVLVRKDLKGYFDQPTGYILLVIFAGVTSYLFFEAALTSGEASLRPLFGYMPWILAIFVPAATMRLVAEEQRDGTLELLLTQPLRGWNILAAKYLTGLIFVSVGLATTLGMPILLATAGNLDEGAIIAQYLGALFLIASFVAIGLFTSSLTRNQIVAFVIGLTIIIALMLAGLPLVTFALPSGLAVLVQTLSPLTHFTGMARGVIDLRDVIYFVALVSTFLSGTYLNLRGKSISHRSPLYRNLQLGVAALIILSILVGWSGNTIRGRLDLTEGKLYTLSPATEDLLSDLGDIVTIKLYSSKDPSPQVALVSRDVNDFLDDMASASKGKIRVVRSYPDVDEEARLDAERNFIPPVQFNERSGGELKVKQNYLGMGMTFANRKEIIPFISSVDGLEYRITSNIFKMLRRNPKYIGLMFGHGEKRRDSELQVLRDELERHHTVEEFEDEGAGVADVAAVDVLIVAGPTDWIGRDVFADIDQFLSEGGNALFLVDSVRIEQEGPLAAKATDPSLRDYLREMYGVDVKEEIVFDVRSNETLSFGSGGGGSVRLAFPYWVTASTLEDRISGGVPTAVFPWAAPIDVVDPTAGEQVEVEVTPLLATSEFGASDPDYGDITVQSQTPSRVREDELGQKLLAVALTGTRCPAVTEFCEKDPNAVFRIVVASDSDWIGHTMAPRYRQNLALAANWINWLTEDEQLATVRAKGAATGQTVFSSKTHQFLVQYSNVIGVPAAIILLGLIRYLLRRNMMRKEYTVEG